MSAQDGSDIGSKVDRFFNALGGNLPAPTDEELAAARRENERADREVRAALAAKGKGRGISAKVAVTGALQRP